MWGCVCVCVSSFWISIILQALIDNRLQKDGQAYRHILWQMCARDPNKNSCHNQSKSSDIKRSRCKNVIYSINSETCKIDRNSVKDKVLFHLST